MDKTRPQYGALLKRINDILEKTANNRLRSHGITDRQFKMLLMLYHREGGSATLKELEKYFHVAQSTAAGIAMRLEKKKLIDSYTDPADRRIKHIRLTESGRELCLCLKESILENEQYMLSKLNQEEREQLLQCLQKVYETLR